MNALQYYFWVAPHIVLVFLAFGLLKKGLHRKFPIFFIYVLVTLVRFVVTFTIVMLPGHTLLEYQWAYVVTLGASVLLRLVGVYELGTDLLTTHSALAPDLRSVMRRIAAMTLLLTAVASALLFKPGSSTVENWFLFLDFSWAVILCGLLIVLFFFSHAFRISWRSYAAGIALGYGVFAAVELATSPFRSEVGMQGNRIISLMQMAAHHICVVIWLVYLFLPDRRPQFTGEGLRKSELESWQQELEKMVG